MKVRELMKKNPTCVTLDTPIEEAARLMAEVGCGVLPVIASMESAVPIGVLTDRDIVMRCIASDAGSISGSVGDVCTKVAICCERDCSVDDAFKKMRTEKVGRLLVTDKAGELAGIVSMADIIAAAPREVIDQLPGARRAA